MRILLLSTNVAFSSRLRQHLANLGIEVEIEAPTPADALRTLSRFDEEWRAWLSGEAACPPAPPFHGADLMIAEESLPTAGRRAEISTWITALRCAGQARVFIAISRESRSIYDTALLRRSSGPFDLLVAADDLMGVGLWTGNDEPGAFLPWTWPILTDLPRRRARQVEELARSTDQAVCDILNIPQSVVCRISSDHASRLSADLDLREDRVTPTDILRSGEVPIESADRLALLARLDLSQPSGQQIAARLLAPVLEQWLDTAVIDQPIALDAPRLLQATGLPRSFHARLPLVDRRAMRSGEAITAMFEASTPIAPIATHWSARAWLPTSEVTHLAESLKHRDSSDRGFVFCDDTSRFVLRSGLPDGPPPKRISPEIGKGLPLRWIEGAPTTSYLPRIYVAA